MQTLPALVIRSIETFARFLGERELPGLSPGKRDEIVAFVVARCLGLPSITRFGVAGISLGFGGLFHLPRGRWVLGWLCDHPLPLLGEYPRLIRSLTFAYVFETWPESHANGATP